MAKGRHDLRRVRCGLSVTVLWRRCDSLFCAFLESASMAASLLMKAGVIPARMGCWFTGVARRVPGIILRALLRVTSSFFDMVTMTPNWGTVLCSRRHQGLGRGIQRLRCSSPCSSSKATCQSNMTCGLCFDTFQVLLKCQRVV